MTIAELLALPPTISVERAAEILSISRGLAYQGAADGTLPTIAIGRRRVVPTGRLLDLLGVNEIAAAMGLLAGGRIER